MIFTNITDLIGNTPILQIGNLYLKLEYFNPTGSIKDRPVFSMLSGQAENDNVIVEATSGNTGIALAALAQQFRKAIILVMPEDVSDERKKLLKMLGAKVHYTDSSLGIEGAKHFAKAIALANGYKYLDQFHNPDNVKAHIETTAKEIIADMAYDKLDYIVAGIGTGGTLGGIYLELKKVNPDIKAIGVIPATKIDGITRQYENCFLLTGLIDIVEVTLEEIEQAKTFAFKHGVLAGPTGLANIAKSLKILDQEPNKRILAIIPDSIFKYLHDDV